MPQYIRDKMNPGMGQTGKSGRKCEGGFNNAQWIWASKDTDSDSGTPASLTPIDIPDSANTLALRANLLGAYCDSIISPSTGNITDKSLDRTGITITNTITVTTRKNGVVVPGANITVVFPDSDRSVIQSYNEAGNNNWRYTKKIGSGRDGVAANLPFSLAGLNNLPASDDMYVITLTLPVRMVNDFPNKYPSNQGPARFICVDGSKNSTQNIFGSSGQACNERFLPVTIKVRIQPEWAGECSITSINGINPDLNGRIVLQPGQTFDAGFRVKNSGTRNWSTFFMKLGTNDPLDNTTWGPQRTTIVQQTTINGFPVVLANGGTSSWTTSGKPYTAPSSPGEYSFSWRILQEGGAYPDNKTIVNMAECDSPIVVKVKENKPFIYASGGDVVSGALFTDSGPCQLNATNTKATSANIKTNGYFDGSILTGLNGSSGGQYSVFASGMIGDVNNSGEQAFRGNYGYARYSQSGSSDDLFDGLFANLNVQGDFGQFYKDDPSPPLPCVDVSAEMASAAANPALDEPAAITFVASGSGYMKRTGKLDIPATLLTAGTRKTIVVDGNVTIKGNITYPASYTSASIPYLKIIANNIYIEANAKQIDANLVAYPNTATNGVLDTCSNMQWQPSAVATPGNWSSTEKMTTGSCKRTPNSFVVNGAVAARRILWKRTNGTLGLKDSAADPTCYFANYDDAADVPWINPAAANKVDLAVQRYEKCAAELIKFSPEAYLAGFTSGSQNLGTVPTSTQELPPIF
ncbi:hypothetical protein KBD20_00180 [Candidatus Saccharibacteria bacterium]|nr:hypothetical protein [Candidatus Saccharibacteria bacterium]